LREEPIIYINEKPFVVRDIEHPFQNLNYYSGIIFYKIKKKIGISVKEVEEMEERLKKDIIEEKNKYEGNLLVHDESANNEIVSFWESISKDSIKTPKDVFESLIEEYKIQYFRLFYN
jgi:hypothetical protein